MFLGMAYGIYMNASGFSFIFTGSLLQLSVASSVLYSPLIQKASALSWLLCSSLSSWISGWKKRIIHLHYLDLEFLFSVSLYSDRTLLWFRPWFWLSSHWHYYAKSLISRIKKTTRDIISTNVLLKKWNSNKKHRRFANMTLAQQIITIGLCVLGTMTTRFLPFLVFHENRETPKFIQYVGKFLPSAVFGMLVVYCLRNVNVLQGTHGIPEFISILITAGLHIWKRQMLVSIAGGTICYILLLHFC